MCHGGVVVVKQVYRWEKDDAAQGNHQKGDCVGQCNVVGWCWWKCTGELLDRNTAATKMLVPLLLYHCKKITAL